MKFGRSFIPACNAQAVASEDQIIVAAGLPTKGGDFGDYPVAGAADLRRHERAPPL